MKLYLRAILIKLCAVVAVGIVPPSHAAVLYTVTNVGGDEWQYDYEITNSLAETLRQFTIFFGLGSVTNLVIAATPGTWDSLVAQPDTGLPADGFFDSLSLESGLGAGSVLSGFSVRFRYLGTATPGSQRFEFIDSDSFEVLTQGQTVLRRAADVPAPGGLGLAVLGLIALTALRNWRSNASRTISIKL